MEHNKKTRKVEARVTEEQYQKYKNKAEKNGMSITALVINSLENNITINLDTSNYRDLVIQFRRIGNNINNIIKHIHFNQFFTDTDILDIKKKLNELKIILNKEKTKISETKKEFENLTPKKLKNYLEKKEMEIPLYLIYDEIVDHINLKLRSFIDLINNEKWEEGYTPYIEVFIKKFHPTDYSYDELVNFSDDLDNIIYNIDQRIIIGTKLTYDDFMNVMNVLNKYRKDSDE
ncbi:plasmid mobilization protein [Senegalia sp. (in: firmicutes)]|uniref:plasmid mobilization protein n=1 Tax=Senegalia sp. (in: firmicutes) TaxID=1924098 RepID=UPI003F9635EC